MRKRNLKMRVAAVAVPGAVAIAVVAIVLSVSSSAQPVSKASAASAIPTAPMLPAYEVTTATRGSLGSILVNGSGATLYRYDADKPNMPTSAGSSATAWPPLLLPAGTTSAQAATGLTGLGTITLADGRSQVTYNKMPLYTFASDSGTGVNGQGVGGFFVIHASTSTGKPVTTPTSKSSGDGYDY